MALVKLPNRRIRRNFNPDYPVEVALDNPLAAGLVCLVHPSSVVPFNLISRFIATGSGSGFIKRPRPVIGNTWYPVVNNTTNVLIGNSPLTYPYTFFALVSAEPATATGPVIAVSKTVTGNNYLGIWSSFVGNEFPTYRGTFGTIDATAYQLRNTPRVIVGVSRSATAHELWVDGVLAGSSAGTSIALDATFDVRMGSSQRSDGGTDYLNSSSNVGMAGAYNRGLSSTEIINLSSNILQLIRPKSRGIWVPVSAGGGTSTSNAFSVNYESLATTAGQRAINIETLRNVLSAYTCNYEALTRLGSLINFNHESLQGIASPRTINHESLASIARSCGLNHEALAQAATSIVLNYEAQGFATVTRSAVVNIEALGYVSRAGVINHESLRDVNAVASLNIEALRTATMSGVINYEALARVSVSVQGQYESASTVSKTVTINHESLSALARLFGLNIEALQGAVINQIINYVDGVAIFTVALNRENVFTVRLDKDNVFAATIDQQVNF